MRRDDEINLVQEIHQYQVLKYIEQFLVLCQDELYYEEDSMDMELNPFHLYDLYKLNVDN